MPKPQLHSLFLRVHSKRHPVSTDKLLHLYGRRRHVVRLGRQSQPMHHNRLHTNPSLWRFDPPVTEQPVPLRKF